MSAKENWTPLEGAGLLDDEQVRELRGYGITTVEELAGQLSSEDESVGQLLGIAGEQLVRLKSQAVDALPEQTRRDYASAADFTMPPRGARNPDDT